METGKYKHYKGAIYNVIGVGLHTETQERMVLYYPDECPEIFKEQKDLSHFVRPYEMFNETIEIDGKQIRRFTYQDTN